MTRVSIPAIGSICKDLDEAESLWRLLADRTHKEAASTVTQEVEDFRDLLTDPVLAEAARVEMLEPMFSACELALVQLTDMVSVCVERTDVKKQLFWPDSSTENGTFMLQVLLTNLANTLLGIRQLVLLGLDGQARVLLRWFVELSDLTIAASYDYDCCTHYVNSGEGFREDYKRWRSYLAPGKIRKVPGSVPDLNDGNGVLG